MNFELKEKYFLYIDYSHIRIKYFLDVDWLSTKEERKSTLGYCVFVGGS